MFDSIQRMVHKTRTTYGDSAFEYGGDDIGPWENYPQGVLQGNAAGPTIWILVSSVIFEVLHKRGFAVQICTSVSKETFKLVGFSYVDDCDLIQSGLNMKQCRMSRSLCGRSVLVPEPTSDALRLFKAGVDTRGRE